MTVSPVERLLNAWLQLKMKGKKAVSNACIAIETSFAKCLPGGNNPSKDGMRNMQSKELKH